MLNHITGTIKTIKEKHIIVDINGIGLSLNIPQTTDLSLDKPVTLYTYLHWNQEQGPSLYAFKTELERMIFLLIIDCHKVGPSLGINVLAHFSSSQFLEIITAQDEKRLSQVSGIGAKKAEQIIVELKHKVQKLLASGNVIPEAQENFVQWQNVSDVLTSLNYSKVEITNVMQHLATSAAHQNY